MADFHKLHILILKELHKILGKEKNSLL